MRILERHVPLPELDLAVPRPRSYVVSPAGPPRSEVAVKRIQASTSHSVAHPVPGVTANRGFHAPAGMSARRVRGLSLLVSLLLVVVVSPLAALSILPWWSFLAALAVLIADFASLRRAAVAERAARRAKTAAHRTKAVVRRTATPAPWAARPASQQAAHTSVQHQPVVSAPAANSAEATTSALSQAEPDLTGWAPIPVPPPTYTLKAKAERPAPAPAAVVVPAPAPPSSFDGLVDEDELDGLLDRRAAGA
jgi:hypothetical protein